MEIKIIYDNQALAGFQSGWGFSCLIEIDKTKILFDTGDGPNTLFNLEKIGISPAEIEHIILSHSHYDHVGGLIHLLHLNSRLAVYVPSFFPIKLKLQLKALCKFHETFGYEQITENSYIDVATNRTPEQFCMLNLKRGLLVITGCAHPGLDSILQKAEQYESPIFGVIGGFHSFKKLNLLKTLSFIAPCHCTSNKDAILKQFPNTAHSSAAGVNYKF